MEKNKSNNLAVCIICGVLTVFGLFAIIVSLLNGSGGIWMVSDAIYLGLSVLIGYYAISGYRRPHGNLLKYIILIYATPQLVVVYQAGQMRFAWLAISYAVVIGILCYVAGRLHRVKQNWILMRIIIVLIVVFSIVGLDKGIATIGIATPLIIWIDICAAYFFRYKEHRVAGLMDKE